MTRILRKSAGSYPLTLLLLCSAALFAADSDETLIERLEAAETVRQRHDVLDEIRERTMRGPLSENLTDRLIAELMSEQRYNFRNVVAVLPQLGGEQGFSRQSLVYLAQGLSGDVTQSYSAATSITAALSPQHANNGLPEEAFAALLKATGHRAMLNRSAAIEVLAVTREDNDRYSIAIEKILHALNTNEHQHTRSSAIAGLARLTLEQPMASNVLAGLVRSATADTYMTVRMDALEVLATRDIDAALGESLSTSLAAEIVTPTRELWARSSGLGMHDSLGDRATTVLAQLHQSPYPAHVVNAWIAQTRGHLPDKSLEPLAGIFARGELTDLQTAELVQIAEAHRLPVDREMIYRMLFVELQAGALMDVLSGFEYADNEASRIRAGYALEVQYRGKEVPDRVADVAARVALAGSNAELRAIAASLLSHTNQDREHRESQLIAAVKKRPEDYDVHKVIIDFYGADRLDELVTRYAAESELSISFRTAIIRELGEQTNTEGGLSPDAENALKTVARNADDYYLMQAAGNTLDAWGIRAPLRVAIMKRENQSMALLGVLGGLVLLNLVAGIVALVSIFKLPLKLRDAGKRKAIRMAMVIGWLALSAGMTVLLAAGVIGFMGHNWAPRPSATLMWNIPAYAGSVIYVLMAWILTRRARQTT